MLEERELRHVLRPPSPRSRRRNLHDTPSAAASPVFATTRNRSPSSKTTSSATSGRLSVATGAASSAGSVCEARAAFEGTTSPAPRQAPDEKGGGSLRRLLLPPSRSARILRLEAHERRLVVRRLDRVRELRVDVDDVVRRVGSRCSGRGLNRIWSSTCELPSNTYEYRSAGGSVLDEAVQHAAFSRMSTVSENSKSLMSPSTTTFAFGSRGERSRRRSRVTTCAWPCRAISLRRTGGWAGPKSGWSSPFELKWLTTTKHGFLP